MAIRKLPEAVNGHSDDIIWNTDALRLSIKIDENGTACLNYIVPHGKEAPVPASPFFQSAAIPLDGVRSVGDGHTGIKTSKALLGSMMSARIRYVSHHEGRTKGLQTLDVISREDSTGIEITHHFAVYDDVPVLRSWATVRNTGKAAVPITQLSSISIGGLTTGTKSWWNEYSLLTGGNAWFREAQWHERSLPDLGIDTHGLFELNEGHRASQARFTLSNHSSFSTGTHLPMGLLKRKDDKDTWLWQIEHNGSWRWEIGDFQDGVYLVAGGPTRMDHDWGVPLAPGDSFTTVTAALCHVNDSPDAAFAALTKYRRRIRRQHKDHKDMPIIFNDYMNCLMGDPTEDKIKALIDPVCKAGAEYFVIDAGWYADDSNWWDDVGLWEPSPKRFPSGFKNLLDHIRANGLIPGVWVEPEVVGVRSKVGEQLPEEAFFQDHGHRVIERGRFQLDFRRSVVRTHMTKIIAKLVEEYGVGYFKFDYNIEVITGSDADGLACGATHLDHQRAYLAWINELLDRYPDLVIENCSSGAQRMDYAMLATHTLQSTSDQQDPVLYAAIAAAVPTAVVPEQSATWAYPQRAWSDEVNALTVVNSMLGRVHLSGELDRLEPHQLALVHDGMNVYKSIRHELNTAVPFWPLGLPKWHDEWVVLGLVVQSGDILLSVWRRGGPTTLNITIPIQQTAGEYVARLLYPSKFECHTQLVGDKLEIRLPEDVCARVLRISRARS